MKIDRGQKTAKSPLPYKKINFSTSEVARLCKPRSFLSVILIFLNQELMEFVICRAALQVEVFEKKCSLIYNFAVPVRVPIMVISSSDYSHTSIICATIICEPLLSADLYYLRFLIGQNLVPQTFFRWNLLRNFWKLF